MVCLSTATRLGSAVVHAACLRPPPRRWDPGNSDGTRRSFANLHTPASVGFPVVLDDLDFLQHKLSNLVLLFFLERPLLLDGGLRSQGKRKKRCK